VGFTPILLLVGTLHAQTDPGLRPSAGGNAKRLPLADFFAPLSPTVFRGSEASAVINNFNALSASNQQDVLNFLRSL
jgi:hypothetical protein